jgi:hypothetical protein
MASVAENERRNLTRWLLRYGRRMAAGGGEAPGEEACSGVEIGSRMRSGNARSS